MPCSDFPQHRVLFYILACSVLASCDPFGQHRQHVLLRRETVEERPGCQKGVESPATRVNTTLRLAAIRHLFSNESGGSVHAYIVPSGDAHQSEYPSAYDLRRGYISGFSGSAGTAVISTNKAALWTDVRYFLEAEDTLDCNWILMKIRIPGVPSITDWLIEELKTTPSARVGANPFFMDARTWKSYSEKFKAFGITMVEVNDDLVDQIWISGRPAQPDTPVNELPMDYAGRSWEDKIKDVRAQFADKGATAYIVTSLDETAWLFNLRASDISYNPFFISYAIVETNRTRLYLLNHNTKLTQNPSDPASTKKVYEHLNTGMDGSCGRSNGMCVEVLEYNSANIRNDIAALASSDNANKLWVSLDCSQAIYGAIPQNQRIHAKSAISLMKAQKNYVERRGMQQAHIRDAVALITFMAKLEQEVREGKYWTEVAAAMELKQHRLMQKHNRGLSFASIAGSGSNGAIIHYRPANATDKQITTSDMFLLDSGGQYLDGTTDVTRTFHFGKPTNYEKECYTRVLMGHINVALLKWPRGLYGRQLDAIARTALWDVGLRYLHGSGHGIGAYLSVHERPYFSVSSGVISPSDVPLDEHMFLSDEPGYYEDGKFGIRLETILTIKRVETKYRFPNTVFLGFHPVDRVPYEPHLIDFEMLNQNQKQWLVDYHKLVTNDVVPRLSDTAKQWAEARTQHFTSAILTSASSPAVIDTSITSITFTTCLAILIVYNQRCHSL